jgi:hypothetical protein
MEVVSKKECACSESLCAISVKGPGKRVNQDAYAMVQSPYPIVAIADGHGSEAHYFSDIGAQKAVACALEVMRDLCDVLMQAQMEAVPEVLLDQAAYDIQARWQKAISVDSTFQARPFGTTLMTMAYVKPWLICLQIGDGILIFQNGKGQIIMPMPKDTHLYGEETHSLSEWGAWRHFRRKAIFMTAPPLFFGGCTDGLEKAYPFHPYDFHRFFIEALFQSDTTQAAQAARYARDDVTAAAIYFAKPELPEGGIYASRLSSPSHTLFWRLPQESVKSRMRITLWLYYALRALGYLDSADYLALGLIEWIQTRSFPEDGNLYSLWQTLAAVDDAIVHSKEKTPAMAGLMKCCIQCLPEGRPSSQPAWQSACERVEALQAIESKWNYDFEQRTALFTSSPKGWSIKTFQKVMTLMMNDTLYGYDFGYNYARAIIPIAKVVAHRRTGRWGLRNLSAVPWTYLRAGESAERVVSPGETAALTPEMTLYIEGLPAQVTWRDFVS